MESKWPLYEKVEDARCFVCARPISKVRMDKEMAHGTGRYYGFCYSCSKWTWFDIKEKDDEGID